MRSDDGLGRDARRLVARSVGSVGDLDLLLLLHADQDRRWTVEEVCAALRCPAPWARDRLDRFRRDGLVVGEEDGRYAYAGGEPRASRAVDALARLVQTRRADVVRAIFATGRRRT